VRLPHLLGRAAPRAEQAPARAQDQQAPRERLRRGETEAREGRTGRPCPRRTVSEGRERRKSVQPSHSTGRRRGSTRRRTYEVGIQPARPAAGRAEPALWAHLRVREREEDVELEQAVRVRRAVGPGDEAPARRARRQLSSRREEREREGEGTHLMTSMRLSSTRTQMPGGSEVERTASSLARWTNDWCDLRDESMAHALGRERLAAVRSARRRAELDVVVGELGTRLVVLVLGPLTLLDRAARTARARPRAAVLAAAVADRLPRGPDVLELLEALAGRRKVAADADERRVGVRVVERAGRRRAAKGLGLDRELLEERVQAAEREVGRRVSEWEEKGGDVEGGRRTGSRGRSCPRARRPPRAA